MSIRSSRLAAASSSGGASLPRLETKASWARTRSDASHAAARRVVRLRPCPAGPAPCRTRPPGPRPQPRPVPGRPGAQGPASAPLPARGMRRRRPGRRGPVPGRPRAPVPRRRPHPARARPARGARHGGPGRPAGSVTSASADARPAVRSATRTSKPPSAPADAGTAPGHRSRAGRPRPPAPRPRPGYPAARRRATAAPDHRSGRPPRPPATAGSRLGRVSTRRRKLSSIRPATGSACGSPKPPASSFRRQAPRQLQQRQRIAPRLGDDLFGYPLIQRPPHRRAQQLPRVSTPQAGDRQLGQPAQAPRRAPASRTPPAPTPATAGAPRTPAPAPRPGPATARHQSRIPAGGRPATSDSRLSAARPTRKRSGAGPACRPNAICSASRCGPGSRPSRCSIGPHSWCSAANASSISDSTPDRPRHPQIARRLRQVIQQRGLPDPRLAPHHQGRAAPATHLFEQPAQHLTLAAPSEQHAGRSCQCLEARQARQAPHLPCAVLRPGPREDVFGRGSGPRNLVGLPSMRAVWTASAPGPGWSRAVGQWLCRYSNARPSGASGRLPRSNGPDGLRSGGGLRSGETQGSCRPGYASGRGKWPAGRPCERLCPAGRRAGAAIASADSDLICWVP